MAEQALTDRQVRILGVLGESGRPGRIAYLIGLGAAGRKDATVRNSLEAMERRGWVRRRMFEDYWRITESGRARLAADDG